MRLAPGHSRDEQGSTLAVVMLFCFITLLILASALGWVTTNADLSERNNEYFRTVAVAEAATEKVISKILTDYKIGGDALVLANASRYPEVIPTATEDARLGGYVLSDGRGNAGRTFVENIAPTEFRVLSAQYRGLRGYATPFRIISNARQQASRYQITGAVRQDIEATTIPLFQFAIFYNIDLEINPGPVMTVTGPVHGNENIYLQPQATLTFQDNITSAGSIINNKKPGDPSTRPAGKIVFGAEHLDGVSPLNLPIGTDNSPTAVRQVIEPPPADESPASPLGSQRLYNKADMIITVRGNTPADITVTSGIRNNKGTTVPGGDWDATRNATNGFIKQVSFYNAREAKTVTALEIDVAKLRNWNNSSANILRPTSAAGDVGLIYVDDKRTTTASTEPGVRLVNGSLLPPKGLTVVTPDPIYVQGDYNTKNESGQSGTGTDTRYTKPAALIGDAITVLSPAWKDAASSSALGSRIATEGTVNAAFLGGIVPTTTGKYSGGVENFPRFLEDWAGKKFTYNGSMVVMFPSRIATGDWRGTGSSHGIYNPPTRAWAFDTNFRDVSKLPPGTPMARAIVRSVWKMVKPNTTTVADL